MAKTTLKKQALNIPQFSPYGKQFDFVMNEAHFSLANGGIGSGKSIGGAMRAILASMGQIGQTKIQTPNLGIVTAPTYPMLRDATLRTFEEYAGDLISKFNKSEMRATMLNGSEVLFRSADNPDRLRGANITWWWGDEAAYTPEYLWKVMVGRLRQGGKLGYAWLTTTPKGRNWIYKKFVNNPRKGYVKFQLPTRDNPFLDLELIEEWALAYVGDFARQELDGDFVAFEGLIYPEFDRGKHVSVSTAKTGYKYYIAGVDWGFNNPGVILVGGVDSDGAISIVHEEYQRQRQIDEWANVAYQIREMYPVEEWFCDPSEPEYIKKFRDKGLNAKSADNTVNAGIQSVKKRLVVNRLKLSSEAANTVSEFEQYQWMSGAKNSESFDDRPLKSNDHAMDALRYLIFNHDARQTGVIGVRVQEYA